MPNRGAELVAGQGGKPRGPECNELFVPTSRFAQPIPWTPGCELFDSEFERLYHATVFAYLELGH